MFKSNLEKINTHMGTMIFFLFQNPLQKLFIFATFRKKLQKCSYNIFADVVCWGVAKYYDICSVSWMSLWHAANPFL